MYVMYIITLKAYLFSIQFAQLIFAINKMLDDLSFMCAEEIQAEVFRIYRLSQNGFRGC